MTPYLPEPVASVFVALVGLVVGSFLNVCIHRLPRGESIVRPGSRCPSCGSSIRWYHNVPVLSWLLLRGKCADCSAPISFRYPFVEALAAALVLGAWWLYGPSLRFAFAAPFSLAMLVLFFTDWDLQLLPDAITLTGFVTGMATAWFNPALGEPGWHRIWMAGLGAAIGAGFLWGVGAIYKKIRGVEAMGMGDVKMMALVGSVAGPQGVVFTIFAASVVGAVVGVALIPLRGRTMRDTLPFGCFLAPAAVAALAFGRRAVEAYVQLVIPGS